MGKTIDILKQELREVREQRDRIRQTRDTLRAKLEATERQFEKLGENHLDLWTQHHMPEFDTAIPSEGIVEHIAYKRGMEVCTDARMLREGWFNARQVGALAESVPGHESGFSAILDFGCGCARVTRYLTQLLAPGGIINGCDIDDAAIQWNLRNLQKSGGFFTSPDHPPLPLPATEQFDLIVVISVFTHLPEAMQDRWMEELTARLKPGGVMVATFHGPYFERFIPDALRAEFEKTGFCYSDLGKTPSLPDYYLTTFHSHDYITSHWGKFAEVIRIEQQGVGWQDAAVLRRPTSSGCSMHAAR